MTIIRILGGETDSSRTSTESALEEAAIDTTSNVRKIKLNEQNLRRAWEVSQVIHCYISMVIIPLSLFDQIYSLLSLIYHLPSTDICLNRDQRKKIGQNGYRNYPLPYYENLLLPHYDLVFRWQTIINLWLRNYSMPDLFLVGWNYQNKYVIVFINLFIIHS